MEPGVHRRSHDETGSPAFRFAPGRAPMSGIGIGTDRQRIHGSRSRARLFATAPRLFPLARPPRLAMLADVDAKTASDAGAPAGVRPLDRRTGATWSPTRRSTWSTSPPPMSGTRPWRPRRSPPASRSIAKKAARPGRRHRPPDDRGGQRTRASRPWSGSTILKNPMLALAREILQSGEIGSPVGFPRRPCRGLHGGPDGALDVAPGPGRPGRRRDRRSGQSHPVGRPLPDGRDRRGRRRPEDRPFPSAPSPRAPARRGRWRSTTRPTP